MYHLDLNTLDSSSVAELFVIPPCPAVTRLYLQKRSFYFATDMVGIEESPVPLATWASVTFPINVSVLGNYT